MPEPFGLSWVAGMMLPGNGCTSGRILDCDHFPENVLRTGRQQFAEIALAHQRRRNGPLAVSVKRYRTHSWPQYQKYLLLSLLNLPGM